MLIDLETVADADVCTSVASELDKFSGWDKSTLDEGRYTTMSNCYSLGRLMEDKLPFGESTGAMDLMNKLKSKTVDAAAALKHPWLMR